MRAAPRAAGLVATPLQALQGEFFLRTGQKDKGRPMLEEVARKVRAAPGPDAWTQALFTLEAIARAARDVGDWDFAGWAARQMLEHDSNYAGSHWPSRWSPNTTGMRARRLPSGRWWRNTGAAPTRDCGS